MSGTVVFSRFFATAGGSSKNSSFKVFDKSSKLLQRSKYAKLKPELSRKKDYLRDEIATKTIERLAFITRPMDNLLDFGSNAGNFLNQLSTITKIPSSADEVETKVIEQLNNDKEVVRNKIKTLTMLDSSKDLVFRDKDLAQDVKFPGEVVRVVSDEEDFSNEVFQHENQYDAVISNLSLHWINNLPETLSSIHKILKKDGFFMATLFGGDTLYELRTSLQLAELERKGGISPRVSPLVHLNDVGSLLNKAGFSMLTIDSEDIVVGGFPDIISLCEDLQIMGENNSILSRSYLDRDVLVAADQIYRSLHGEPEGLPATFSVVFFIGWKN
ncbi:hypothetical protein CTRG_02632 [Candida tropicalis MYA-3404]|uniref:Methyltransferase type 11 domain-containing protein n=1 Tax=Candida tropicalis (strain ATCC MYA-3404 / T1) TaxID=294747 RepID=C5M8B0_CANTT|nr:hypothetical protein CTRG_02632 [Candida tropicalis MYA-3404]EER33814.1 hypothetical protein CTRG_02632 [Candida tropicalis MYA-3404]KAG4407664.1 hypothetical protein JTP64_003199 [Candida tropicalis]